jgi:hypothetical protein
MTMDTAVERTGPIGTLILITDDEMRDILTHIAVAGDRVLFDRLHDRWTSLRYGTRSGPEVQARGRVVSARHTTLTYSSGEPIRVGDTVRRSRTAQSLYEVTDIRATGRPSVGLVPRYGYTRASAIGVDAVAALVLVEEARPTTDLGLDLPLTLEGTDR